MKLNLSLSLGTLLVVSTVAAQTAPLTGTDSAGSSAGPPPVYTNRQAFRIPYQYDPREISRLGAREIRMFVSRNQGRQWKHVQSVTPQTGRFEFRAETDGEYWFSVKTVDRDGQLHPGGSSIQPGLAVVVDTVKPTLEIDLREAQPGRVALDWMVIDQSVDPDSLVLEFTQTGMSDWRPVAVKSAATGTTTWSVPSGGLVAVRGSALDHAGNKVTSQYQIQISSPASAPGRPLPPPVGAAVADIHGNGTSNPLPQSPPGAPAPLTMPPQPGAMPAPLTQTVPPTIPDTYTYSNPSTGSGIPSMAGANTLHGNSQPDRLQGRPGIGQSSPDWRDQFVSATPGTAGTTEIPTHRQIRESIGHRVVKSRQFEIDYRVDDIGPSGVSTIELFVTQDEGNKWYRYGVDEDRISPFVVDVPADGVYGFSMRAVSGAGQSDDPPQPGSSPDVVIVVDSSPPVVQLFPLRQGQGANSNRILITWQVADQKLADRPIALSYSTHPQGPWQQITGWEPNDGEYIWQVGTDVPPKIFVRIVARDAAGNMARVDTPQPVLVDLAKPTARIVDVGAARSRQRTGF